MTLGMGKVKEAPRLPEVPDWWKGSKPEYYVFLALTKLGIGFEYQNPQMGGRLEKGGAVIDFYIPSLSIGINIQSTYWHYTSQSRKSAEAMQRAQLESYGITMVYIDEEDVLRNPWYYTSEALKGNDHSRMA